MLMNFLKAKVQKYYEKKLSDAQQKLKFHAEIKNQLDLQLKRANEEETSEIREKIQTQVDFMDIWEKNIREINKQFKKLKS